MQINVSVPSIMNVLQVSVYQTNVNHSVLLLMDQLIPIQMDAIVQLALNARLAIATTTIFVPLQQIHY